MTKPVTVHTQDELDQAIVNNADVIYIESETRVSLTITDSGSSRVVARGSSRVVAWDSSRVEACGSSSVEACGSSRVVARGSSRVVARDSSSVVAWGSSRVVAWGSSRVEARDSSSVEAWDSSSVEACGSSRVVARGSSSVEAWGSSSVEARGSSSVEAWDSSSVEARDSSSVVARDSSRVVAWGSSSVEASKYVAVHLWSQRVTLDGNGHIIDMTAVDLDDPAQWCELHGVEVSDDVAYLYKAVDDNWTTGRGIVYAPGSTPEAVDWHTRRECGGGLHLCASPSGAKSFKVDATKFVKCGVRLEEMVCLDDKVKVKRVVVPCVEVDIHGRVVEAVAS